MAIQFFFTDWAAYKAKAEPGYPQKIVEQLLIPLMTLEETEQYIRSRLDLRRQYMDAPESEIPACTDKELWRKEPVYKYYMNPAKMTRSTNTCDTMAEAMNKQAAKGGKGIIVTVPGQVVACRFCPAFTLCTQKDAYLADGTLLL
jgi:hypothetical protein